MTAMVLAALLVGPPTEGVLVSETRPAFASIATVSIVAAVPAAAQAGIEAAFAQIERVEWAMNEWLP